MDNDNKEQYVYSVFQSIASGYDSANRRISLMQDLHWKRSAARMLCSALPDEARILDIGCGTGDMMRIISEEKKDVSLTGLDFSPNMLKVAKNRLRDIPSVRLVRGNAMELPFDDDTFDGAVISFALRNTADYDRVLSEALRVIKNGGRFVCIDSFVPENRLIKPFYGFYFSYLMPLLGGGLGRIGQYRWLNKSTSEFICAKELAVRMKKQGFTGIKIRSFLFGACVALAGTVSDRSGKDKDVRGNDKIP